MLIKQKLSYLLTSILCCTTLLTGLILTSISVSADSFVDNVSISVSESCTITTNSGSGNTYNVTIPNGQYKNDIGKTRLSVFCNTEDTFAIYAVGYSNDTVGNNEMIASSTGTNNIATGTATSGDTSNWAMKVEAVAGTGAGTGVSSNHISYTPTIISPFNDFAAVPSTWSKVAEVASVTGVTNEAAIDASYAVYIAPKQAAANYTGKVRYTVVHPASVDPGAGQANLDTGVNINTKLKSLASGTNVTSYNTTDTLITAFVRSDTLPTNFNPSDTNTISASNSLTPVYVWFDDNDGTMYYYSKANEIWMNANSYNLFNNMKSLTNISGLKYFITDNVADMGWMFYNTKISDLTPITNWKVDNVTRMNNMFDSTQISYLTPLTNWKVDNVTRMDFMFRSTKISDLTPITNWKVDNAMDMKHMFNSTQISNLTPLSNWNVSNVTNMNYIFYSTGISDLTPITNWKVDKVTSMDSMFRSTKISDLTPLANWNVSNVMNMTSMFSLTKISDLTPLANWNVSNVMNMTSMFSGTQISDLTPITNWKVDKVTSMSGMFSSTEISDLTPITNWKVDNVTRMTSMFSSTGISDLTPLTNWKVDNVTSMSYLFSNTQISDLTPLANWNVGNVTDMGSMFYQTQISDLTPIAGWDVSKVTSFYGTFSSILTLKNSSAISIWNVNSVIGTATQSCAAYSFAPNYAPNCFYEMFKDSSSANPPIFTSRPGTWDSSGTYIPNP